MIISTVGDIMLGENTHHFGRGIPSLFENRYPQLLDPGVLSVINATDLFFANLECSLISTNERSTASLSRAVYAAPESALSFFDAISPRIILNIANNHFGQHGIEVAYMTVSLLEQRNIICIGQDRFPKTMSVKEFNFVCWGSSLVNKSSLTGTCFETTPDTLVREMYWPKKHSNDFWIVSLHWGEEYRTLPEEWQRKLARNLVDKGVDLVLGHHPHVIQPVEKFGESIVLFSQGNFVFDQNFSCITQEGLLTSIYMDTAVYEAFLVKQRKYIVYLQNTTKHWLSTYCKKNSSTFASKKMRIAMKIELFIHVFNSNFETIRYFFRKAFDKIRGSNENMV